MSRDPKNLLLIVAVSRLARHVDCTRIGGGMKRDVLTSRLKRERGEEEFSENDEVGGCCGELV
jgi:hypothetical protein